MADTNLQRSSAATPYFRYQAGQIEFRHFAEQVEQQVHGLADDNYRCRALRKTIPLCVTCNRGGRTKGVVWNRSGLPREALRGPVRPDHGRKPKRRDYRDRDPDRPWPASAHPENHVQIWFGWRPTHRRAVDGQFAWENGGTLVYSLGPMGDTAVILYPARSKLVRQREQHIYLGIGYYTAHELNRRVRQDFRDLAAYTHVSSIDGQPTAREQVRIWWLRQMQPAQIKGEFTPPPRFTFAGSAVLFLMKAALTALLRPLAVVAVVSVLLYLKYPDLAKLLSQGAPR